MVTLRQEQLGNIVTLDKDGYGTITANQAKITQVSSVEFEGGSKILSDGYLNIDTDVQISGSLKANGFIYPSVDGLDGYYLGTDGSKTLSFKKIPSTPTLDQVIEAGNIVNNKTIWLNGSTQLVSNSNLRFNADAVFSGNVTVGGLVYPTSKGNDGYVLTSNGVDTLTLRDPLAYNAWATDGYSDTYNNPNDSGITKTQVRRWISHAVGGASPNFNYTLITRTQLKDLVGMADGEGSVVFRITGQIAATNAAGSTGADLGGSFSGTIKVFDNVNQGMVASFVNTMENPTSPVLFEVKNNVGNTAIIIECRPAAQGGTLQDLLWVCKFDLVSTSINRV